MSLWSSLFDRLRRPYAAPLTPPEEHAAAKRRLDAVRREADRLERLVRDYREMERGLGR